MQITIRHYDFQLDAPYVEGSVLTLGEAQALNSLRAENIRNNISKVIKAKLDALADDYLLSADEVAELQALVDDYAQRYFFKFREGQGDQRGQLSAETYAIARDRMAAILRASGSEREPTQGEIAEMQRDEGIQAEARANIEARTLIARQALEEL